MNLVQHKSYNLGKQRWQNIKINHYNAACSYDFKHLLSINTITPYNVLYDLLCLIGPPKTINICCLVFQTNDKTKTKAQIRDNIQYSKAQINEAERCPLKSL